MAGWPARGQSALRCPKPFSPYNEKREKLDFAIARPKLRAICVYYYMSLLTKLGRETSQKARPTSRKRRREMPTQKLFSYAHAPVPNWDARFQIGTHFGVRVDFHRFSYWARGDCCQCFRRDTHRAGTPTAPAAQTACEIPRKILRKNSS